jgi:hypothetical protein
LEEFTLHAKLVPTINTDAVSALPMSDEVKARWQHGRGWLDQIDRYDAVPRCGAKGMPTARLTRAQLQQLETIGVVEPISAGQVAGWTKVFLVPEVAKRRFRPIKHTFIVNEALGKDSLQDVRFPSKREICELVHSGECFIAVDFSAYFDQFEYSPEVSRLFCFRGAGKSYRLRKLAMGQRQAVEVASTATDAIRDFADKRSKSAAVIDNVFFGGSRSDVLHDAALFVDRVNLVGAKLNEDVSDLDALVQTTGDWCGVHLDMSAKTVALTQKTIAKLTESWRRRLDWTWRNFAAHVGLLFWTWGIIDVPMAEFFPLLRFVSSACKLLAERPDLWEQPAVVWPSAWPTLSSWTDLALANHPRVVPQKSEPEWLVCTDASRWGWGYVAVNTATGDVHSHGAPWSAAMEQMHGDKLRRSTFAEPHGILNTMCHLLSTREGSPKNVRVGTDSTVARAAYDRGFNTHSFDINECLRRLRRTFEGRFTFEFFHIPGADNPADGLSRGRAEGAEQTAAHAISLRRLLGFDSVDTPVPLATRG